MKYLLTTLLFAVSVICLQSQVIFEENFEDPEFPDGWTVMTNATDGGWSVGTVNQLSSDYYSIPSNGTSRIIGTNDDRCNCNKRNEYLVSPRIDLGNVTGAVLSVQVYYLDENFQGNQEDATVEISTDGTNWTILEDLHGHDSWDRHDIDISDYAGEDSVYIGFRYDDGSGWLYGLAIDDVVVSVPPAIEAELVEFGSRRFGETDKSHPIIGGFINGGADTIHTIQVSYTVNGGTPVTETIGALEVPSFEFAEFEFSETWIPASAGDYELRIEILMVNGEEDEVADNNVLTNEVTIFPGVDVPNKIDEMLEGDVTLTTLADASVYLDKPTDLDFFPVLGKDELWIVNQRSENEGGSTLTINNTTSGETRDYWSRVDGNAWHFMSLPTAIAFSDDNFNFSTSPGVKDANHNNGTFTGPTLWSSDPEIYAQPSGGNGSHLDMLHGSPFSMGVAHEVDNVFWVYDNWNKHIVRYDFVDDHGPGNDYHGDALVRRYQELGIFGDSDIPSHLILDKDSGWLYIVDSGNDRVLRLDINSGEVESELALINEPLTEHSKMGDYTFEVVIDTGLQIPCGIEIFEGNLLVGDYLNGDIRVYDMTADFRFKGIIPTGAEGLTGIKVGPDGNIWYTNRVENSVGYVEPGEATATIELAELALEVLPNPATSFLQVTLPSEMDWNNSRMHLMTITGQSIMSMSASGSQLTLDVSALSAGNYVLQVVDGAYFGVSQFTIQR